MNISLTKELEELVLRKVQSGRYNSASEVVREGLRLLEHEESLRELQRTELRKAIAKGARELDRGEGVPGKKAFAEVKKQIQKRRSGR